MGAARDSMDDDDATVNRAIFGDLDGGESVARQTISREDLMQRLTKMIQACEGCEQVHVVGVTRLESPDKDGRNWSHSLVLDAAGVAAEGLSRGYAAGVGAPPHTWDRRWARRGARPRA